VLPGLGPSAVSVCVSGARWLHAFVALFASATHASALLPSLLSFEGMRWLTARGCGLRHVKQWMESFRVLASGSLSSPGVPQDSFMLLSAPLVGVSVCVSDDKSRCSTYMAVSRLLLSSLEPLEAGPLQGPWML
jgi:hypothetical protein